MNTYWESFYKDTNKDYLCAHTLVENLELFYFYLNNTQKYCETLAEYYKSRDQHQYDYWFERLIESER